MRGSDVDELKAEISELRHRIAHIESRERMRVSEIRFLMGRLTELEEGARVQKGPGKQEKV